MIKLRPALKAHGIDEQTKKYRSDAIVYVDTELSDQDAGQQSPSDAAQDEAANFDFSDQIAERDRCEERK